MGRSRNLADLLDANGDVKSGSLDNVPASNDASALTTGTLSADRLAAGSIGAAKLAETYLKPDGDGSGLSGIASDKLSKDFVVDASGSLTQNKVVSIASTGKVGVYPQAHTGGTEVDDTSFSDNHTYFTYSTDGSRALYQYPWGGSYTAREFNVRGLALSNTGNIIEGSSTNVHTFTGLAGSTNHYTVGGSSAVALSETKFLISGYYNTRYTGGGGPGSGMTLVALVEVNANGSCTVINHARWQTNYSNSNLGGNTSYTVSDPINGIGFASPSAHNGTNLTYLSVYADATTNTFISSTQSGSSQYAYNGGAPLLYNNKNSLLTFSGTNTYKASKSGNYFGSSTDQGSHIDDYSSSGSWTVLSQDRCIFRYTNASGNRRMAIFSIDSNGDLTNTDNVPLDEDTILNGSSLQSIFYKDDENFGMSTETSVVTGTINSDGTFGNWSPPFITTYGVRSIYTGNDVVALHRYNSNIKILPITINAWSSPPFSAIGIASENASAGATTSVQVSGVVGGFTGLSAGTIYHVDKSTLDGSLVESSSGNAGDRVGRAISSTEILLGEL
jgi:hypothetical protein